MEQPDDTLKYWETICNDLCKCTRLALSLISNRELDGDPNGGITETGFKLIFLCTLGNSFSDLYIESEREVDGGRLDLYLYDAVRDAALVVELKYVRVGFLLSTGGAHKLHHKEKYKVWGEENDKVRDMTEKEKLLVKVRHYVINTWSKKNEMKILTVDGIINQGSNQSVAYCKALREGDIRRVDANTRLFRVVLCGIGKNVTTTPIVEYK